MMAMLFYEVSLQSPWFSGILSSNGATLELEKLMVSWFTLHWAQLQNPGPHQRPLDVAATGCAKYVRDNLHVNETIRKITIHK